jgi:hypothetical protein
MTRIVGKAAASLLSLALLACATSAAQVTPELGDDGRVIALCAAYYCDTRSWPAAFADVKRFADSHPERVSQAQLQISSWERYQDAELTTSQGNLVLRLERLGNSLQGAMELEIPPPSCSSGGATLHDIQFRAPPRDLP